MAGNWAVLKVSKYASRIGLLKQRRKMKGNIFLLMVLCLVVWVANAVCQNTKSGKICGDPNIKCRTGDIKFAAFEIQFEVPKNAVISSSEPFYAVVLESKPVTTDTTCVDAFNEQKRLEIQKLFPANKVFAFRCDEFNTVIYKGVAQNIGFMAVYAGKTLAEANAFLKKVQAAGKFKGANVRKLRAEFNAT